MGWNGMIQGEKRKQEGANDVILSENACHITTLNEIKQIKSNQIKTRQDKTKHDMTAKQ